MEHKDVKLVEKRIHTVDPKKNYVEMLMPEGWRININTYRNTYGGYTYPYTFSVILTSPDNTVAIYYYSPRNFLDDHLNAFKENQVDDYGNMHHSFTKVEDYLDLMARSHLSNFGHYEFVRQIDPENMDKRRTRRREIAMKDAEENGEVLNWHYFDEKCRVYSYRYKDADRIRCYSAIIEGSDTTAWSVIPGAASFMNDPMMKSAMMSLYRNVRFDSGRNEYVYSSISDTSWNVRKILSMDCMDKDFEFVYSNIFRQIVARGVTICDEIWKDFRSIRQENEKVNAQIREDRKKAAEINRKAAEERRRANQELYDYIRKTQDEIQDIRKSAYENSRRTHDKVSEMWTDVNRGNTRFVDRHGDEHVIHTYDNYAYKSGNTYVTSDSPLDHSYEWEELKKKKY